jgi:hypothetical protein
MASPWSRKLDKDRSREGLYLRGKIPVRYVNGPAGMFLCGVKPCSTLTADASFPLSVGGDAVSCSTLRTMDDNTLVHQDSFAVRNEKRIQIF